MTEGTRGRPSVHHLSREDELRAVIAEAIGRGEVPTPTDINLAMTGRKSNVINGRWTKVRTEMLEEAGYRRYVSEGGSSRWVPPGEELGDGWSLVE